MIDCTVKMDIPAEDKEKDLDLEIINDEDSKENVDTSDKAKSNQKYLEIEEQIARIVGEKVSTVGTDEWEFFPVRDEVPSNEEQPPPVEFQVSTDKDQLPNVREKVSFDEEKVSAVEDLVSPLEDQESCVKDKVLLVESKVSPLDNQMLYAENPKSPIEDQVAEKLLSAKNVESELQSENPNEMVNSLSKYLNGGKTLTEEENLSESENSVQEEEVELEELETNEEPTRVKLSNEKQYNVNDLVSVKEVKELFACDKCEYTTQRETSLRLHNAKHHNKNSSWKCIHCKKKYPTKFLLNQHAELIHSKKFRSCPNCDFQIYGKDTVMRKHMKRCYGNTVEERFDGFIRKSKNGFFQCSECSLTTRYMKEMKNHVRLHRLKYSLHCMHCKYLTDKERRYHMHLHKNHLLARDVYICDRCFFQTETLKEYEEHAQVEHEYHKCTQCDYQSFYVEEFYSHCDQHNNLKCEKCENFIADSIEDLEEHNSEKHGKDESVGKEMDMEGEINKGDKVLGNSLSDKELENEIGSPKEEKRKDHSEKSLEIEEHDQNVRQSKKRLISTSKNGSLPKIPKQMNSKFKCKFCEKSYSSIDVLVFHEKHIHKTKVFQCPICVYKVNSAADFIVHWKEHLDEEEEELMQAGTVYSKTIPSPGKFNCKLCNYSADELKYLKDHLEAKHEVRYYKCAYCNFAQFTDPDDFNKHLNKHCSHCNFETDEPGEMKSHMLKHVPRYKNIDDEVICDGKIMKKKLSSRPGFKIIPENPYEEIKIIIDTEKEGEEAKIDSGEITVIIEDLDEENCESQDENDKVRVEKLGEPVKIIRVMENQCFDCLQVFKNRTILLTHRRDKHLSKKPHSCTYCFECFKSFSDLKTHYYRVHKVTFHNSNPVFGCPLCFHASDHLRETRKHVMRVHGRGVIGFKRRWDIVK